MTLPESLRWRPLWLAFGLAVAARIFGFVLSPDHAASIGAEDFLSNAAVVEGWLVGLTSAEPSASADNPLFALFWHAPGYSLLVSVTTVLFGEPGGALAVLQALAGLCSGLVVYLLLRRQLSGVFSLGGALVIWLHPSMLFFEQQISPVALCTLLCALLTWRLLALFEEPGDLRTQWQVGASLAPLPWLASGGLALLAVVAVMSPRDARARCIGPAVSLWLPAMMVTSLWLGMWTPLSLDVPTRVALGNNPIVGVGQGSLLGNPEALQAFRGALEDKCGDDWTRDRLRCEARSSKMIAVATFKQNPTGALRRVVYRLIQTWVPDRSLPDALQSGGRDGVGSSRLWQLVAALILPPLHLGLLVGLAFAAVSSYRLRHVRFMLVAALAWTVPVLFSVGATSFRQAALPWLICAALFAVATVGRRSGEERRAEQGVDS